MDVQFLKYGPAEQIPQKVNSQILSAAAVLWEPDWNLNICIDL